MTLVMASGRALPIYRKLEYPITVCDMGWNQFEMVAVMSPATISEMIWK